MSTIPVRVPADTMPTVLDAPRVLPEGHPGRGLSCAACVLPILGRAMVTVYVGTDPDQRRPGGAMRGTGVPVHADCAGVTAETACEHVWVTALDGDNENEPARDADGRTWVHCGVCGTPRGASPRLVTLSTPCARPDCHHPYNWHVPGPRCTAGPDSAPCPCAAFQAPADIPATPEEH
ncbi:hypothetical protein [Streptomyces sp. MH60]|uniref:hypothetical protein n=1 Tax=Streptomyces sp. MH60 TaxID=1940758 RepID=UPI000D47B5D9|nr:hypothetical protein [Streptomyces sp. MH60]PPS89411.1 hypothetical protein BZZ08_01557 [Streptomyces sp. MH60]